MKLMDDIDATALVHPPEVLRDFVERIAAHERTIIKDRRAAKRYRIAVPVVARPLNEMLVPDGPEFRPLTRDVSPSGISLVHTEPIDCELLALEMDGYQGEKIRPAT